MLLPLFVILAVFLSTFTYIYFMSTIFSRSTTLVPCTPLGMANNKPFNGLIGPSHIITSRGVVLQNWVARCSPCILQFSKSIWTQYYIFDLHFPEAIKTVTATIHYRCYCLMASGKWRSIVWCRNINVTSFIFLSKNV